MTKRERDQVGKLDLKSWVLKCFLNDGDRGARRGKSSKELRHSD